MKDVNLSLATGRCKTAKASVFIRKGSGGFTVNGKAVEKYFSIPSHVRVARDPISLCIKDESNYSFLVNVKGGGLHGQSRAILHGLSRAILAMDSGHHKALREKGFLTRDPRMRERKKYGRAGARRSFQFSKR